MNLLLVFCWAGDEARFHRHLPHWQKSGLRVLPVYPYDAPLTVPGLCAFRSEQFGPELLRRHIFALRHAYDAGAETVYATEADSVCVGTAPQPFEDAVGGCLFHDPANPQFRAKTFLHWFWSFNRPVLARFLAAAEADKDALQERFADRWISLVCERHGIPLRHDERVFSRNQFDTPELLAEARAARSGGAWAFHGTKTEEQLRALLA
jgi:hypothetical protein